MGASCCAIEKLRNTQRDRDRDRDRKREMHRTLWKLGLAAQFSVLQLATPHPSVSCLNRVWMMDLASSLHHHQLSEWLEQRCSCSSCSSLLQSLSLSLSLSLCLSLCL